MCFIGGGGGYAFLFINFYQCVLNIMSRIAKQYINNIFFFCFAILVIILKIIIIINKWTSKMGKTNVGLRCSGGIGLISIKVQLCRLFPFIDCNRFSLIRTQALDISHQFTTIYIYSIYSSWWNVAAYKCKNSKGKLISSLLS
jgi:hypothetical protein